VTVLIAVRVTMDESIRSTQKVRRIPDIAAIVAVSLMTSLDAEAQDREKIPGPGAVPPE
jgi:hypothetical protein